MLIHAHRAPMVYIDLDLRSNRKKLHFFGILQQTLLSFFLRTDSE